MDVCSGEVMYMGHTGGGFSVFLQSLQALKIDQSDLLLHPTQGLILNRTKIYKWLAIPCVIL